MESEKELQEKMLIYRTLESKLEVLAKQRDLVSNKTVEIMSTISSIEELNNSHEGILFKLGGEAYAYGNINKENKILVEIGAGIILEKSAEDAKIILKKRGKEMENAMSNIQSNIVQISNVMSQLGPEINGLIQKSQNKSIG